MLVNLVALICIVSLIAVFLAQKLYGWAAGAVLLMVISIGMTFEYVDRLEGVAWLNGENAGLRAGQEKADRLERDVRLEAGNAEKLRLVLQDVNSWNDKIAAELRQAQRDVRKAEEKVSREEYLRRIAESREFSSRRKLADLPYGEWLMFWHRAGVDYGEAVDIRDHILLREFPRDVVDQIARLRDWRPLAHVPMTKLPEVD